MRGGACKDAVGCTTFTAQDREITNVKNIGVTNQGTVYCEDPTTPAITPVTASLDPTVAITSTDDTKESLDIELVMSIQN